MSAFGIGCTVAWTELYNAMVKDGIMLPTTACGPNTQKWIEDVVRDALEVKPIDMVLYCPRCGMQHIDAPEKGPQIAGMDTDWHNPPHRSHLCHGCGCVWRPADVPTNGVKEITTKGKADNFEPVTELKRIETWISVAQHIELCNHNDVIQARKKGLRVERKHRYSGHWFEALGCPTGGWNAYFANGGRARSVEVKP